MNECQRLFLIQARSNLSILELLRKRPDLPACHALHYLQMATEMLGKALTWKHGQPKKTHRAFVPFLRSLYTNRQAQKEMGHQGQNANWENLIRKSVTLAKSVEDLAPALARDGPNPEYPWPGDSPRFTPAEHEFEIWKDLQARPTGRQFLNLTTRLFASAEAFL